MSLPLSQLCLASFSPLPRWGVSFLIEQSLQHPLSLKTKAPTRAPALLPFFISTLQTPYVHTSPWLKPYRRRLAFHSVCLTVLPVVDGSLPERVGNRCWHFHHRLWAKDYKPVGNSFLANINIIKREIVLSKNLFWWCNFRGCGWLTSFHAFVAVTCKYMLPLHWGALSLTGKRGDLGLPFFSHSPSTFFLIYRHSSHKISINEKKNKLCFKKHKTFL